MQLVVSIEDVRDAPKPVQDWFSQMVIDRLPKPSKPSKPSKPNKAKAEPEPEQPEPEPEPEPEVPSLDVLIQKATSVIKAAGSASPVAVIVKDLGIGRVSECPEDKRTALLEKLLEALAIHG